MKELKELFGQNAILYRDTINAQWKNFYKNKDERFNHITNTVEGKLLINLFAVHIPIEKRIDKFIKLNVDNYFNYNFVFPLGKIIGASGDKYKVGDIISIPLFLTRLVRHPEWGVWDARSNESPQPPPPEDKPAYLRNIDYALNGWVEKLYVDPFVKLELNDRLYYVTEYNISMKYDKKLISPNLNSMIDARI